MQMRSNETKFDFGFDVSELFKCEQSKTKMRQLCRFYANFMQMKVNSTLALMYPNGSNVNQVKEKIASFDS